jgi:hypothetical protein
VRQRNLPISAICQRALREEVDRRRRAEEADDILVYVKNGQADPDPWTWPGWNPAKPKLIYQEWPVGRRWELGWVLTYELGDDSDDIFQPGDPTDPPVEWAREVVRRAAETREREAMMGEMQGISLEVGKPALTVSFTGRWLVEPEPDETRGGSDAGAYWGIALTKRGRIAVYIAHVNEMWPAALRDYDSLDQAADDHIPEHLIALAAAQLGEQRVLWRDI